jgi:hypothetical protein
LSASLPPLGSVHGDLSGRREFEEAALLAAGDREVYLRSHSGLPGPRGNLELIDVASAVSDRADLERWAALGPEQAPENTPESGPNPDVRWIVRQNLGKARFARAAPAFVQAATAGLAG